MCDVVGQFSGKNGREEVAPFSTTRGSALSPSGDRILVVGFSPFRGRLHNGSQSLLAALEKDPPRSATLEVVIMPVVWGSVESILLPKIETFAPTLLLGVGEGKPGQIAFERTARNTRSGVDERGVTPENNWIEMDGPERLSARLSYQFRRPKDLHVPFLVSEDAGEFLCNAVLYRFLESRVAAAGFVHVPPQELMDETKYVSQLLPVVRGLIEANRLPRGEERGAAGSAPLARASVS